MIVTRLVVLLIIISLISFSCSASKQETSSTQETKGGTGTIAFPTPLAPNTCRFIGTVVEIASKRTDADPNDPCSKAPCFATVQIDSVIGYGSAFPTSLGAGATLRARFAHTLSPTKDVMPELTPALPGLQAGSRFKADVIASPVLGGEVSFTIYAYERQR